MADTFALEVLTPEQVLLAAAATAVVLRTSGGALTVLAGHASFVGDVVPGEVRVELEDAVTARMAVHGGYLQVDTGRGVAAGLAGDGDGPITGVSTRVTLLAGVAEFAEQIDVARAELARSDALAQLEQLRATGRGGGDAAELAADATSAELERELTQQALRRAELRLQVAAAGPPA
jgi:F0F1-type ATP synthase epsilon subunit